MSFPVAISSNKGKTTATINQETGTNEIQIQLEHPFYYLYIARLLHRNGTLSYTLFASRGKYDKRTRKEEEIDLPPVGKRLGRGEIRSDNAPIKLLYTHNKSQRAYARLVPRKLTLQFRPQNTTLWDSSIHHAACFIVYFDICFLNTNLSILLECSCF